MWSKRLSFGLALFIRFPPPVALAMVFYAVRFSLDYGPTLLRSFASPLFGGSYPAPLDRRKRTARLTATYVTGDLAAKKEALQMLAKGNGEPSPQVAAASEGGAAGGGGVEDSAADKGGGVEGGVAKGGGEEDSAAEDGNEEDSAAEGGGEEEQEMSAAWSSSID